VSDAEAADPLELLVVMTCFRAAELTIDCLRTLEPEVAATPGVAVAICENGSDDGSGERLRAAIEQSGWEAWVRLLEVSPNRGFAGGNNVVLRDAMARPSPPRRFLLLNTDTWVRRGALAELLRAAAAHPEAGVIGSRLEWPDGEPQISAFRDRSPLGELIAGAQSGPVTRRLRRWDIPISVTAEPIRCDWVSFASALLRREVLEAAGLLDEGYYLYFDDADYCRVARHAGFQVLYWPRARVVHLRGKSNPVKERTRRRERRPAYYYASRARYFAKFYGRRGLWLSNLLWTAGHAIALAREVFGSKDRHTCEREWRDIWFGAFDPMRPLPDELKQGRGGRS
jgi:N-acetylglucosaminyl-diphospho-decaprenol L-rhamnosyltransferase